MRENDEEYKRNKIKERLREEVRKEVQKGTQLNKSIQAIIDIQQSTMDLIRAIPQPVIDMHDSFIENMGVFSEMNEHITGLMNIIDWESISDAAAERIKEIDMLLKEHEENFWCLDFEILDAVEEDEMDQEHISEYVSKNLDSYVEEIVKDPMYELHATLIQETYEAFKGGYYKLCAMPLFAAFEHVLATWGDGNINADMVSVRQKPIIFRVTKAISPEKYSEIEEEQFTKVFSLSVIRMLHKTFVGVPKELCQELNRNSIAHGFHDYDAITKTDILKLFQLLKSTLVIKYFDTSLVRN
ncbi:MULTISPECIES: hypothetical protein [Bacillus cereus group]|uniref:hypothetical protein n=1 Tax=Bacillus cereus group TaxID=86661 RepID=UPI0010BDCE0D|nr:MULTISPECIES: hypothetical protein [Bacillus cereus group]MCU5454749.1 hypothetical protein [Bacillus cereus]MCU5548972.1 hypothetical protein [Bacillus cereus]MCU5680047.1 hypothetical protein [Bacillus cereus]TKH81070.1 hypothetical protein FC688_13645 [Bacillus cereus]HDR6388575.1 hypothetical protein [Bacillus cereus]